MQTIRLLAVSKRTVVSTVLTHEGLQCACNWLFLTFCAVGIVRWNNLIYSSDWQAFYSYLPMIRLFSFLFPFLICFAKSYKHVNIFARTKKVEARSYLLISSLASGDALGLEAWRRLGTSTAWHRNVTWLLAALYVLHV